MARAPIAEAAGWVYRSDAPAPAGRPAAAPPAPRVFRADQPRFRPNAAAPPVESSWLSTGICLMTIPITFGMTLMFAPVMWMLGSRSKR